MAEKSIIAGEYILQIADNGHVDVVRVFRNAKKTMTDIAATKNFSVEEKWNTRDLGRHLVKEFGDGKTAKFDDITINKMADGRIEIYQECKNTKEALRTISEQLGFEYDKDWTTQQFGAKLEKFLEEHKDIADKVLKTPNTKKEKEEVVEEPAEKIIYIEIPWYDMYQERIDDVIESAEDEGSELEDDMWHMVSDYAHDRLDPALTAVEVDAIDESKDGLYITDAERCCYMLYYNGDLVLEMC